MNLVDIGEAIVGFRPEHFVPAEFPSTGARVPFAFQVESQEYLGSERILYGKLAGGRFSGKRVVSRLPASYAAVPADGAPRAFGVDGAHLKFFDERHRIAPGPAPARLMGMRRQRWLGPAMLLPAIFYVVALVGVPFLLAFYYAVGDVKVGIDRLPLRRSAQFRLRARRIRPSAARCRTRSSSRSAPRSSCSSAATCSRSSSRKPSAAAGCSASSSCCRGSRPFPSARSGGSGCSTASTA